MRSAQLKSLFVILICMLLSCTFQVKVFAVEGNANDKVKLSITTDKNSYKPGEDVLININLKNTSGNVIKSLEVTNTLANDFEIKDRYNGQIIEGNKVKWQEDKLDANGEINYKVKAYIKVPPSSTGNGSTNTNSSNSNGRQTGNYPVTATNYFNILLYGVVLLLLSLVLLIVVRKDVWKKIYRKLSAMIAVVFILSCGSFKTIKAAENEPGAAINISQEYKINYNDKEAINKVEVKGIVIETPVNNTPTTLKITNSVDSNKVLRLNNDSVDITGTSADGNGIKEVKYELTSPLGDITSGTAEGKEAWKLSVTPKVGTSTLKVIAVDNLNTETSETIYLDKLSTSIKLTDNVWAPEKSAVSEIAAGIVDYWQDDNGTPNDYSDDGTIIIFKENDPVIQELKANEPKLRVGSVLMLPPCEALLAGFTAKIVSFGEPSALNLGESHVYAAGVTSYPDAQCEFVRTVTPDMRDMYADDVRLDFTSGLNQQNPVAFAILPDGASVGMMDGQNRIMSYFDVSHKLGALAANESGVTRPGFQWGNVSQIFMPQYKYDNDSSVEGITVGFNDVVIYDKDGDPNGVETKGDRINITGKFGFENIKTVGGVEWHPSLAPWNFDVLPQQIKFKTSYDSVNEISASYGGSMDLKDVVKLANKSWQGFENEKKIKFLNFDISAKGVSMDDGIVMGAIGFNLNLTPVPGRLANQAVASEISPVLVVMLVLDLQGNLEAKTTISYKYNSYNEQGYNIQKKGFTGAYGPLESNLGQRHKDLPFDRSLEIYDVQAKSSSELNSKPAKEISFEGSGVAEASAGLGPMIGVMYGGIMPATVRGLGYVHGKINLNGQVKFEYGEDSPSVQPEGKFSINADMGVKSTTNVRLLLRTSLGDPSLEGKWSWEKHFFEYNWEFNPSTVKGKVYKADYDRDTTNNPVLQGVTVTAVKDGMPNAPILTAQTDSQGQYSIANLVSGSYNFTFKKQGYVDYSTTVEVDDDKTFNVIMDVLGHSKLSGKVTKADTDSDTANNVPLNGAIIQVKKLLTSNSITKEATSDANGNYVINELTPGLYEVTVLYPGYFTLNQDFIIYENQANVFNATLEVISEEYAGNGTASGTVINALTGSGVESGLKLNIRRGYNNTSQGAIEATLYTAANGTYSVTLPAGYYTVQILDERPTSNGIVKYQSGFFNIKVLGANVIGNQNGVVTPILPDGQIRIVLKWGATPSDLDSHLVGPNANGSSQFHTYYGSKSYGESTSSGYVKYADLDVDDTSSYGPETTTIYKQSPGIYKFYVHDYTNRYSSSSMGIANSAASIEVYMGNTDRPLAVYNAPNLGGTLWNVFEYNSETKVITGINTMSYESSPSSVGVRVAGIRSNVVDPEKK